MKNTSCHHCFMFPRRFTFSAPSLLVSLINLSRASTSHWRGQTWRRETKCSQLPDPKVLCFQMGIFGSIELQLRYNSVGLICCLILSPFRHCLHTFHTPQIFLNSPKSLSRTGPQVSRSFLFESAAHSANAPLWRNANCLMLKNSLIGRPAYEKWKFPCRGKEKNFCVRNNSWSSRWRQCWELKGNDYKKLPHNTVWFHF